MKAFLKGATKDLRLALLLIAFGWVFGYAAGHGLAASGWSPIKITITDASPTTGGALRI